MMMRRRLQQGLLAVGVALLFVSAGCGASGDSVDDAFNVQYSYVSAQDTFVVDFDPKPDSRAVSVKVPISVTYNNPIQTDRLNDFSFKLFEQTGIEVPVIVRGRSVNSRFIVDFEPQQRLYDGRMIAGYLRTGTSYFIRTQYVKDARGNYIADAMSRFTTADEGTADGSFKLTGSVPGNIFKEPMSGISLTTNSFSLVFNETLDVDYNEFDTTGCSKTAFKDAIQIIVSDLTLPWPWNNYNYKFREGPWPGRFCVQQATKDKVVFTAGPNVVTYYADQPFPGLALVKIIINVSDSLRGATSKQMLKSTEFLSFFNVLPNWAAMFGTPVIFQ